MIATINLLPWRQTRRRACLRFWSVLFGASLLLSSGVLLRYYSVLSVENQVELLLADAEKTRAEALMALKPRVQLRQQRWQQVQARNKQRSRPEAGSGFARAGGITARAGVVNKNNLAAGDTGTDGKHAELCRAEGAGSAITPAAAV